MNTGDYFNLAALAAFLLLSVSPCCRKASLLLAACVAVQFSTNYDTINALTPNVELPVVLVMALLYGYFAVSLTCQLVTIKRLRFGNAQFKAVSFLAILAVLNDIIGLCEFYNYSEMVRYEVCSIAIITLQAISIWTLRNGLLYVHDVNPVRSVGNS